MEMFQALNFCRVQSAPPSFLMVILQNSKILLSRWPAPIFLGKIAEWILETLGFQLLGDLPGEAGLKQSTKEAQRLQCSSPAREFLPSLHVASVWWNQDHQWAQAGEKKRLSGWGALGLWGVLKISDCSVVSSKTLKKKKKKLLNYSLRCLTLPMVLTNLNYIFILGHEINDYINERMLLHLIDLSSHWTGSCFQGF